ncbi:MAG TPA: acyltransferase [Verrucomicrobiae bacterium]|nr:acyltransferase [Verrucomicrobiae bacterium]
MSTVALSERGTDQSEVGARGNARIDYVDALRAVLILLVVGHHSVEAYVSTHASEIVFADAPIPRAWAFLGVNAAFFMGLFFFLAGYYTPQSFDRRGVRKYLADRWMRLGIPLLLGFVLLVPVALWMRMDFYPGVPHLGYWDYFTHDFLRHDSLGGRTKPEWWPKDEFWPQANFGWLWFIEHLLIYTMLYAAWRLVAPGRAAKQPVVAPAPPSNRAILAYAVALAVATYVIQFWYPQDRWIAFLGFIQMEPKHWPQYGSLFVIGLVAGRGRWIETMPRRRGLAWLAIGILLALGYYIIAGVGLDPTPGWRNPAWEAFMATSFCVGLPVAFRELALGTGRLWKMLGRNVLAIYVFHFPIVLFVQVALMQTDLAKWIRLLLTWPIAAALTVLFTNFVVLRIPGLRRVF